MKILSVQQNNKLTGQEISLLERMKALRDNGIDNELLLPEPGDFSTMVEREGFKTYFCPLNRWSKTNPFPYIKTILGISKIVKDNKFSLIHASSVYPNQYCLPAARLNRIPCMFNVNAMVYNNYDLKSSLAHKADFIISVSKGAEKLILELCPVPARKVMAIYDNIDVDLSQVSAEQRSMIRAKYGISDTDFLIGQVGEIIPRKGFEYFVEMAIDIKSRYPATKFMIIGKGHGDDYEHQLKSRIHTAGLVKDIIFTGFQSDVLNYINALDMLTLSALSEGLGRVLVEGQKLSKPVIGSDIGGINEAIEHEKTGLLAQAENSRELAHQVSRMLDDTKLRDQCVANALKEAAIKFDQQANVHKLIDIYKELVTNA